MGRVKHAFRIILSGNVVSLCDRYPGFENVVTHDADVTCKSCLREMIPQRMAVRNRELTRRRKAAEIPPSEWPLGEPGRV